MGKSCPSSSKHPLFTTPWFLRACPDRITRWLCHNRTQSFMLQGHQPWKTCLQKTVILAQDPSSSDQETKSQERLSEAQPAADPKTLVHTVGSRAWPWVSLSITWELDRHANSHSADFWIRKSTGGASYKFSNMPSCDSGPLFGSLALVMQPPRATPGQERQVQAWKGRVSRATCPSKDSPWPGKQGKEPGRPDATWDEVRQRWMSICEGSSLLLCSKGPWAGLFPCCSGREVPWVPLPWWRKKHTSAQATPLCGKEKWNGAAEQREGDWLGSSRDTETFWFSLPAILGKQKWLPEEAASISVTAHEARIYWNLYVCWTRKTELCVTGLWSPVKRDRSHAPEWAADGLACISEKIQEDGGRRPRRGWRKERPWGQEDRRGESWRHENEGPETRKLGGQGGPSSTKVKNPELGKGSSLPGSPLP